MKYTPDKIGTMIQLKKGAKIRIKYLHTNLSELVIWDKEKMIEGKLAFSSPAFLLAVDDGNGFAHVRLPFASESGDVYLAKV